MTHDTEALKSLLAKVEAATGPDRDLDGHIMAAFEAPLGYADEPANIFIRYDSTDLGVFKSYVATPASCSRRVREYTASIDAALALVERVLPDHKAGFQPGIAGKFRGHILAITETSAHLVRDAVAPTAPLAILGSLLTAALAQGGHHEA